MQDTDAVAQDPMAEMAARPEWKVIERAGALAYHGCHIEAEITRYAAGYHNLTDNRGRRAL